MEVRDLDKTKVRGIWKWLSLPPEAMWPEAKEHQSWSPGP